HVSLTFAQSAAAANTTLSLHDALPISGRQLLTDLGHQQQPLFGVAVNGDQSDVRLSLLQDVAKELVTRAFRFEPDCVDSQQHRRSEEHTSELQSRENLVCRLLLEKKKT